MPDLRKHRGRHPEDAEFFAEAARAALGKAVEHFSWLLTQEYADFSALKLVGDHFQLAARQRTAVQRSSCPDVALKRRRAAQVSLDDPRCTTLGIDGYNVLITVESALAGGLVLVGRDGCCRDLASIHGTYRKVEETLPALRLIVEQVERCPVRRVDFYLDKPVSNSGRLKKLLADLLEERSSQAGRRANCEWNIELVPGVDSLLVEYAGAVATSDSIILDQCRAWTNLSGAIIAQAIPSAWILNLQAPQRAR